MMNYNKYFNINRVFILSLITLINFSLHAQNITFKKTPELFKKQLKNSVIEKINNGEVSWDTVKVKSEVDWLVYSSQSKNSTYPTPKGNNSKYMKKLEFMEPLKIKEIKGKWFHVYGYEDNENKGWIEAERLLLSRHSLLTEEKIAIPRKYIILTHLDDVIREYKKRNKDYNQTISGPQITEEVEKTQNYYSNPSCANHTFLRAALSFDIMYVLKETDGSLLLSSKDFLNEGSSFGNLDEASVYGWIPKLNARSWNSRVCLEPSRSIAAIAEYDTNSLRGYQEIKDVKSTVNSSIPLTNPQVVFKVGKIPANRMRYPVIKDMGLYKKTSIKEIIGIHKNSMSINQETKDYYKDLISNMERKLQRINIIFVVDATESMGEFYKPVRDAITDLLSKQKNMGLQTNLSFALILYRDYVDKNPYEVVQFGDGKEVINKLQPDICKSSKKDKDLEEAQYQALIKGIDELEDYNESESNVIVLIGDCGNHRNDKNFSIDEVVNLLYEKSINLISYQVNSSYPDTYTDFNDDVIEYVLNSAKMITDKDSETSLIPDFLPLKNKENTYKLIFKNQAKDDYVNMFGKFIYADQNKKIEKTDLKESIVQTLEEFMTLTNDNIKSLRKKSLSGTGGTGIEGNAYGDGIILRLMRELKISRDEAKEFLNSNDVTTLAYVPLHYQSETKALENVLYLSISELRTLQNSFSKLVNDDDCKTWSEKRICFQESAIEVAKSAIGHTNEGVRLNVVKNLTLGDLWQYLLGTDENILSDEKLSKLKLKDIQTYNKKKFKKFYQEIEKKSNTFSKHNYYNKDRYENRRFDLNGTYFFWIPLEDIPGTQ